MVAGHELPDDAAMEHAPTMSVAPGGDDEHPPDLPTGDSPAVDTPPAGDHAGFPPPPPPPPPGGERRALRRDTEHRVIGGVAAGLAEYLDVDVLIVRLAFVALAVLGGSGFLLYLAGWLLIPEGASGRTVAHDWMQHQPRRRSAVAIVIGVIIAVIALSNLVSSGPWWHWGWNGASGFFLGLCALALAVVLLVSPGRESRSPLRTLLLTVLVAAAALVVVVAATLFTAEAVSGVPLSGGIGDARWQPTAASQLRPQYRLAMGNLVVDLRNVAFPAGTTHVTATVGIGHLVVEVPPGPSVSVTAHSGVGQVQVFGQDDSGFSAGRHVQAPSAPAAASLSPSTATSGSTGAAHIVLDAQTGVGQVQITRGP